MFLTFLCFVYILTDLTDSNIVIFNLSSFLKKREHKKNNKDSLYK
jgi:hypothetical protein